MRMKPLQVYVHDDELARLDAWAEEHGVTKSDAVRAAIRALVRRADEDPLLAMSGMIQGLPPDLSSRFDQYLGETFVAREEPPPTRGRRRPRPRR